MRNKITCVIIDNNTEHNYDNIEYNDLYNYCEKQFEIFRYYNTDNLLSNLNKARGYDCIITVGEYDYSKLNSLSFDTRKKWVHMPEYNKDKIAATIIAVFMNNIGRRNEEIMVSVITPVHNRTKEQIKALYDTINNQTYINWEWCILNDSTNPQVIENLKKIHDTRVKIYENITDKGNVGYNKNLLGMVSKGDIILELDHDDTLLPNTLEKLVKCYKDTDADFIYSDCAEICDGEDIYYGEDFAFGKGYYKDFNYNGKKHKVAISCPEINAKSIRVIYAAPNHLRAWKTAFYKAIGGHNTELSVCDDLDIIIRTFLCGGKFVHIPEVLYIQNETGERNEKGGNTQGKRFAEIQRTNWLLKFRYDTAIHEAILKRGFNDEIWDEEKKCGVMSCESALCRFDEDWTDREESENQDKSESEKQQ